MSVSEVGAFVSVFRRVSAVLFVVSVVIGSASSHRASAQSAGDDERARMHFQSGRLHFEVGEYQEALAEFRAAYSLSHRATLLLNMANAEERLGLYADAVESLRTYLASTTDAEERARIERRAENLEARVREQEASQSPAESPEPVATDSAASTTDAETSDSSRHLAPALIAYGVAAAGFVTMAVAGPLAVSEDHALADGCGATASCSAADVASADRRALVADIGLGVGVAGAAVGTVLLLVRPNHRDVATSFVLVPRMSRNAAGAVAMVRF